MSVTYSLSEFDEGSYHSTGDLLVVPSFVDKVDKIFVFKEGASDCTSTEVQITHVVIERRKLLYKIFPLTYTQLKYSTAYASSAQLPSSLWERHHLCS